MKELTINLSKFLMKGLAPYQRHNKDEPLLQGLEECFNLMPTETGLEGHRSLLATGWTEGGYFNYLPIWDQTGVLWYWYPVFDGHILSGADIPSEPTTGLDAKPVITYPIQWLEILDSTNDVWKLYPDPVTGETRATDNSPLIGVGLSNMVWRGTTTESWIVRFDSSTHTRYAQKVG